MVITRKYIQNKSETYGYITGLSFANELGVTTQIPAIIEVVTNKEATNGREVQVGSQKIKVKKSKLEVSSENADLLQLLDIVAKIEKYSELTEKETIERLKKYIRKKKFTRKQLAEVISMISGSTAKKLIEWGMIYEFV